jgi:hypothetical protein
MIEPFPWLFSICEIAVSSAFFLSSAGAAATYSFVVAIAVLPPNYISRLSAFIIMTIPR